MQMNKDDATNQEVLKAINSFANQTESRFDNLESGQDKIINRLDHIELRQDKMVYRFEYAELEKRVDKLENKVP